MQGKVGRSELLARDPSGFNLQLTKPSISHFLSLLLSPITVTITIIPTIACPCICTTTIPYYSRSFFLLSSLHLYESARHEDLGRVFAGRTNALLFTPRIQLIHASNLTVETLQIHFFCTLCVIHSSEFTGGINLYKKPASLFLFFCPHIFNLINLHTLPHRRLRLTSVLDHHCTTTLMLSL